MFNINKYQLIQLYFFMVKLKIKPVNVRRQVYTLFFLMLVLLHTSCGERPEEDATVNAQKELNEQLRNDDPQTRFKKALRAIGDTSDNDKDQREGFANEALKIIKDDLKDLNTDEGSFENALNLVLDAMKKVSNGADVLRVLDGSIIKKYIEMFEVLYKKGVRLNDKILNPLTVSATSDDGIEILYYPLVVLGALKSDKKVPFKQQGTVREHVPILWWTLRNTQLNMALTKEMVKILVRPKNPEGTENIVPMINEIDTIPPRPGYDKDSEKKLTPAMYVAYHEHTTSVESNADDIVEMFKYFLDNPGIKLLEKPKKESSDVDVLELNGVPLLSFIVFNATSDAVVFQDRWLAVLDKALQSGDLRVPTNHNKNSIKRYIELYIDPYINQEGSSLNENKQKRLKEVRTKLEKYIGETIPPTKLKAPHSGNGNGNPQDNNKKQKKNNKGKKGNS